MRRKLSLVGVLIDAKDVIEELTNKEPDRLILPRKLYRHLVNDLESTDKGCVPKKGLDQFYGMTITIRADSGETGFMITTSDNDA